MSEENICYVYEYTDPRDNKPFYVGMGKGKRYIVHMHPSNLLDNTPKSIKINEILACGLYPIINKVLENVSREIAQQEEKRLIAFYGKNNLTNKTSGGQGNDSRKGKPGHPHTPESKAKISAAKLGRPGPPRSKEAIEKFKKTLKEIGHPMQGGTHTPEAREKISKALKGKPLSEFQKQQRKDGMKKVWEKRRAGLMAMPNKGKTENETEIETEE